MAERDEPRVVTLREVAAEAGVSVSTVSRVLDERTPRSRSATAQRVRETAERLGYRRNAAAAGLRRGVTGTIGVLVPRLTDAVMALMFEALERAARHRGAFAVVATCGDEAEDEQRATETLLDRGVDGLVLATARLDDALPASLRARHIPHALVIRTDRVSPASLSDDDLGGYLAVRHLLDLGHRSIGIVTGPAFTSTACDRRTGAERALAEAGLPAPSERVLATSYGVEAGITAGRQLLEREDRPTAVFAANDNLAIGVLTAARTLGLNTTGELSIVGYNDIPLASRLPVPLTSVHTPFDQIATTSLDLLFSGGQGQHRALPTLIPRASTATPS